MIIVIAHLGLLTVISASYMELLSSFGSSSLQRPERTSKFITTCCILKDECHYECYRECYLECHYECYYV